MAVSATAVTGASTVQGNKRVRVYDLAFSGTYPTGGESVTAASVGLQKIEQVQLSGNVGESDETGAWVTKVSFASSGASVLISLFEGSTAGTVLTQKPAEAYESASEVRATFIGH